MTSKKRKLQLEFTLFKLELEFYWSYIMAKKVFWQKLFDAVFPQQVDLCIRCSFPADQHIGPERFCPVRQRFLPYLYTA